MAFVGASDTHSGYRGDRTFPTHGSDTRSIPAPENHRQARLLGTAAVIADQNELLGHTLRDGGDPMTAALVFREMLLMGFLVILALFAYTPALSYALAGVGAAVYAAAAVLSSEPVLKNSCLLILHSFEAPR